MHRPQTPQLYLYPATPTPDPEGGATVVFRDLSKAITYGTNDEEVKVTAGKVLEFAAAEGIGRGGGGGGGSPRGQRCKAR